MIELMDDDWQAAQHADETKQMEATTKAIAKAHDLGLSESECMAIAYSAGVANEVYKELRK